MTVKIPIADADSRVIGFLFLCAWSLSTVKVGFTVIGEVA